MQPDGARESVAAGEAAAALLGVADRIAALGDVEWEAPSAIFYRAAIEGISADCAELRVRLAMYVAAEP
jgi:hypothetical protein